MWAGRSTSQLSQTRTRAHSSPSSPLSRSSWSMMSALVLFFCAFLVVVDIEVVTSMSLDRLIINRNNELRSDKLTQSNDNSNSELIVEDFELEALPAGGETDMYVLLPAGSSSERESVNKNIIESNEAESSNGVETGSDMIMMESNDVPVIQVTNLAPEKSDEQKDVVNTENMDIIKIDHEKPNKEEPSSSIWNDNKPIKQVFKNDKDIEDMAIESDVNKQDEDEEKDESEEEQESMVDMLADVVEEVEKEMETESIEEETNAAANKVNEPKDEEKAKWEATVQKLEEKGSEKNKVDDTDMELEAAAVMEEILPEEIVEAMAIAEDSNTSSEEKEDEEENDQKNQKTDKDKTMEKEQMDDTKNVSEENNKSGSNELPKLEENGKPSLGDKTVNKMQAVLNSEAEEQTLEEINKLENLDVHNSNLEELEKIEDLKAENLKVEEINNSENFEAENLKPQEMDKIEDLQAENLKPQETDNFGDFEAENLKPQNMDNFEDFKTEKPVQKDIFEVGGVKPEGLKNEDIKESETHTDIISKEENKDHNNDTSQKIAETDNEKKLIDNSLESMIDDIKKIEQEKEQASNTSTEDHKDYENLGQQNISNEIESTVVKQEVTDEETNDKVVEPMQAGESIEVIPTNVDGDLNKTIQETTMNKVELQVSNPESIIDAAEEPLSIQAVLMNNEDNKSEEMEPIANNAVEMKPIEIMSIDENVEDNGETSKPMKPIQIEEIMNNSKNDNVEANNKIVTNIEIEMESLNKLIENSSPSQIPQKTVDQATQAFIPTGETTMLSTILQIPTLQQPHQQQKENELHNNNDASDSKSQIEQISSDIVQTTEMTIESITQKPQTVISATQDALLNYVNATNPLQALLGEKEQQKEQIQNETKSDNNSTFNSQLRRYDGTQVWRIVVQNDRDRRLADELQTKFDGQLWKEVKQEVDYLLKPQVLASAEKHIRAANLSRIVLIDNLQQVIEVENPALDEFADADNEKGHRLTWNAYHRLADIHEFFDYLAKTYPEICAVETIGYSVQKRQLKVLKISNGNAGNPGVWIDGGMHAREWISPASVTYIANQLAEGWEELPSHMQNINWYIHAVANPDGYEYTHTTDRLWRKNMRSHGRQCPGVDLNRNFGFKWGGKGTSANPCSQTYRGSKAFSEPETFYISKFISSFPRDTFQAFLSFHSYGQYILYPWGYDYLLTNDRSDLDRVARAAATTITRSTGVKYTVGPSAVTLYPAAGGSDDWAKGIANIKYTYTIEMGDSGRYGFILPASHIETNGKDAYTFIQTVARAISHDVRKRTIKLK